MEKILTIVVPAYNAQKFIRTNLQSFCLESLLPDIEILIINDGSTDNTLLIAEKYAKKYPDSYRVINKENGGHGSGINVGIENARGVYYKVVDADDWVEADAFEELVKVLKKSEADIVYSGFLWVFENDSKIDAHSKVKAEFKEPFKGVKYRQVYQFDDVADVLYLKMHNLTIKTEILKNNRIKIDEHCYYVDSELITYPIPYVKTICFLKEYVYRYRIGNYGQSVGLKKMRENEANYSRVINSLLVFYSRLGRDIPCSKAKKKYIASVIARVFAGKVKIALSFPALNEKKDEIKTFDEDLKKVYPEVYNANINPAITLLRYTHYKIFYPLGIIVRIIYS